MKTNKFTAAALTAMLALQPAAFAGTTAYKNGRTMAVSGHVNYFDLTADSRLTYVVKNGDEIIHIGEMPINKEDYYCKFNLNSEIDPQSVTVSARIDNKDVSDSVENITITDDDSTKVELNITNGENARFISDGENVKLQLKATAQAKFDDEFDLMFAEYDKSGKLVGTVNKQNVLLTTDTKSNEYTDTIEYTPSGNDVYTVRAYAWDGIGSMIPLGKADGISKKTYAGDLFTNADGSINAELTGDYTVAYIGGSLTSGDSDYEGGQTTPQSRGWAAKTTAFIKSQFPNASFKHLNAGLGGTTSEYGAIRFAKEVASANPDIVFIEFAVNDSSDYVEEGTSGYEWKKWQCMKYIEKMVRICKSLPKEPVVYFVYAPEPFNEDHSARRGAKQGYVWKDVIADYYGIKTIDIDAYFSSLYENSEDKATKSYVQFLYGEGYYKAHSTEPLVLDVHPTEKGYGIYADTVKEELQKTGAFAKMSNDPKTPYCTADKSQYNENVMETEYNYIGHDSSRLSFTGAWETDNSFDGYFGINGLKRTTGKNSVGSAVSFTTKAREIYIKRIATKTAAKAALYVDGNYVKEFSVYSQFGEMNYCLLLTRLPNDGAEHRITVQITSADDNLSTFDFSDFVELLY